MGLNILIIGVMAILLSLCFILYVVQKGKYKVMENSIIQEESVKAFEKEFPEKSINDLKIEIETISNMILNNQHSNRYTERIQEKAQKDFKLNNIRNVKVSNVKILRYKDKQLKAQVQYKLPKEEYSLVLDMQIVRRGRAFLKKYNIFRYMSNTKKLEN